MCLHNVPLIFFLGFNVLFYTVEFAVYWVYRVYTVEEATKCEF